MYKLHSAAIPLVLANVIHKQDFQNVIITSDNFIVTTRIHKQLF